MISIIRSGNILFSQNNNKRKITHLIYENDNGYTSWPLLVLLTNITQQTITYFLLPTAYCSPTHTHTLYIIIDYALYIIHENDLNRYYDDIKFDKQQSIQINFIQLQNIVRTGQYYNGNRSTYWHKHLILLCVNRNSNN